MNNIKDLISDILEIKEGGTCIFEIKQIFGDVLQNTKYDDYFKKYKRNKKYCNEKRLEFIFNNFEITK